MKIDDELNTLIFEPKLKANATVIWLHGLGADGYDFYGIVPRLELPEPSNIRFIFPHAPIRPVTLNQGTKMRAWYDIVEIRAGSFEDEEGIRDSEKYLMRLIQREEMSGIATQRIVLAGFSQGGVIAFQCGLRYPKPLGGILALSTYLPLVHTLAQEIHPMNREIPIFFAHGIQDEVLPITWARNGRQILTQHHCSSIEWHEYMMGHTVCPNEIGDISLFLQRVLR